MKKFLQNPANFFASVAIIFGTVFIVAIPPFQNPDELAHLLRAYQISDLHTTGELKNGRIVESVPQSLIGTARINETASNGKLLPGQTENRYDMDAFFKTLNMPLNEKERIESDLTPTQRYSPIPYAPPALAISAAKPFDPSPVLLVYASRLAGLAAYVAMVYFAIKVIPRRKWAMATVALLPVSLVGASSLSADTILVAATALMVSLIVFIHEKKKATPKFLITLAVLLFVITMSKQVFVPLLLLLMLVPAAVFKSNRKRIVYITGVAAICLLVYGLWNVANPVSKVDISYVEGGANADAQLNLLIEKPWRIIKVAYFTFFSARGDIMYESFLGRFGWLDTPLPQAGMLLVLALLLFALFVSYEKEKPTKLNTRFNVYVLISALAVFSATCAALYLAWTKVGLGYIDGLQGRYFIPLVFLVAVLYMGKFSLKTSEKKYRAVITALIPVVLIMSLIAIIFRYYIKP